MESLLGRKVLKSKWTLVPNSLLKFKAVELKQIESIVVTASDYSDDCYAVVNLKDGGYCNMPLLDRKSNLEAGQQIDPKTFRVYKLTNGDKTIERCYGEEL